MPIDVFKSGNSAFPKPRGMQVFKTSQFKVPKEDRALETGGSNLEKILSFLNRPGAAEDQVAINLAKDENPIKGTGDILTGKTTDQPSGADVVAAIRGEQPTDTPNKIVNAVAGFAGDVFNPANPLNWIGIGELTKAGKVAQKLGTLSKFTEGLQTGERALLSMRIPFTDLALHSPQSLNKSAGFFLKGVGDAAMALPGAEKVATVFKAPFEKLRTYNNKTIASAAKLAQKETIETQAAKWSKFQDDAIQSVKSGEFDKVNPEMSAHYKAAGYSPKQVVWAETKRLLDAPIAKAGLAEDTPKAVRQFMTKVSTGGDTLPGVKQLADVMGRSLYRIGLRSKSMGIQGSLGELFGAPRIMSENTQKAIERVGKNVETGSAGTGSSRTFTDFTSEQGEAARRNQAMKNKLFSNIFGNVPDVQPHPMDIFSKLKPEAKTFYEMDMGKVMEKYISSKTRQIATAEQVGEMMKDPNIARKSLKAWGANPAVKVDIPAKFKQVMKNLKMSGESVNIGHMYMHPDTAHEFRNFVGLLTDQDKMNKTWGMTQALLMPLTNLFKRITLLSLPGTIPYGMRNAMSNAIQSAMPGALTPSGIKAALYMGNALIKAGDNPAKFADLISHMGQINGLDMGKELALMKEGNLFNEGFTKEFMNPEKGLSKFEKGIGVGVAGKVNEAIENVFRIQHYMSRRLQGWTPQAAIDDVRKYLYDYAGGLSPQLNHLKSVFPFLSWTRLNVPIMFEHMLQRPGKFSIPQKIKQNVESTLGTDEQGRKPDERALDEYIKGDWHIRWNYDPKTGQWSYLRLKNTIPMADLEDFTSVSRFVDMMMSSLTPFAKTPLENYFNQSTFFKSAGGEASKIENYTGETGKFLGVDLPKKVINVLNDVRPLNMANQFAKQPLTNTLVGLAGIGNKSIDLNKATEYAQKAFAKRKQDLELSKKFQQKKGRSTDDIDKLLQDLRENSFVPGSR